MLTINAFKPVFQKFNFNLDGLVNNLQILRVFTKKSEIQIEEGQTEWKFEMEINDPIEMKHLKQLMAKNQTQRNSMSIQLGSVSSFNPKITESYPSSIKSKPSKN